MTRLRNFELNYSTTLPTLSQRSVASTAARIKQAEYEAAEQLAAIEMLHLQLEADLVHMKLEADIAIIKCDYNSRKPEEARNTNFRIEDRLLHADPARREPIFDNLTVRDTRTPLAAAPPMRAVLNTADRKSERRSEDPRVSSPTKPYLRTEHHIQKKGQGLMLPAKDTLAFNTMTNRVPRQFCNQNRTPTNSRVLRAITSPFDPQEKQSPFTVTAKILLQNSWHLPIGWEEPEFIETTDDLSTMLENTEETSRIIGLAKTVRRSVLLRQTVTQELLQYEQLQNLDLNEVYYQRAQPHFSNGSDNWQLIISKNLLTESSFEPAISCTILDWFNHGSAYTNHIDETLRLHLSQYCYTRGVRSIEHPVGEVRRRSNASQTPLRAQSRTTVKQDVIRRLIVENMRPECSADKLVSIEAPSNSSSSNMDHIKQNIKLRHITAYEEARADEMSRLRNGHLNIQTLKRLFKPKPTKWPDDTTENFSRKSLLTVDHKSKGHAHNEQVVNVHELYWAMHLRATEIQVALNCFLCSARRSKRSIMGRLHSIFVYFDKEYSVLLRG